MYAQIAFLDRMLRAKKEYARMLEPVRRKWGLTRNELDILLFLHNNPGMDRAVDIVTRRGIAKSHVSMSVSNLEFRGLLRRRLDPADRRTVHLALTEGAMPIAEDGKQIQQRFFSCLSAGLSPEELAAYREISQKIGQNIEKMNEYQ